MMKRILAVLCCIAMLAASCVALAEEKVILSAGGSFCYAVTGDEVIWGWGDNTKGQLGTGDKKRRFQPANVSMGLEGKEIADIQCGNENAVFLMKDGTVYSCGPNNYGQQGIGTKTAYLYEPTQVPGLENIVQIAAGFGQCLARTADGRVWAWGRNNQGQIGNGQKKNAISPVLLALENIVDIQCGGKFCLAMAEDGTIWGWGENASGQLMEASTKGRAVLEPTKLAISGRFVKLACGGSTAFGLDKDGKLWSWGRNDYGQLGNDKAKKTSSVPVEVLLPDGIEIAEIHAYNSHSAVLTTDGRVWQWGRTYSGQLGNGKRPTKSLPVEAHPDGKVLMVAVGSSCTYVLMEDGRIWASGYSEVGQTGAFPKKKHYISTWVHNGLNALTGEWSDPRN